MNPRHIIAAAAAASAFTLRLGAALADGCGRAAHASAGPMHAGASSFVELAAPAVAIGLLAFAVKRFRR